MEESMASTTSLLPLPPPNPSSSPESTESKHRNPSTESLRPTPPPSSVTRLWRPAAQRNIRNQWSKLASDSQQWSSSSSSARSHATSLVNSYLSQRYMNAMDLGALSDMPDIRKKACWKLFKQQELHRSKLLSSYKDLVTIIVQMVNTSRSMRTFLKGTGSPLVQFSSFSEDKNDNGDGGGIPVYTFWSVSSFESIVFPHIVAIGLDDYWSLGGVPLSSNIGEKLAHELVQMFKLELNLKRLLVVELLSISSDELPFNKVHWLDELYPGEFDDLCICGLYSKEICEPVHPKTKDWKSDLFSERAKSQADSEVLQIYLTTWIAEVNIDRARAKEIFAVVGEEIHFSLS